MRAYPKWMSIVMILAGIYNLCWGLAVVLLPTTTFAYSGLQKPGVELHYPQLWQCIGMIVGVYGFGYLFSALDPLRHWPIIAVGLMGKLFGPTGYVVGLVTGETPPELIQTLIFNDLIWWVPFALILYRAYTVSLAEPGAPPRMTVDEALAATRTDSGRTLRELADAGPVMLVFVRHLGCTYCREMVSDLAKQRAELEARGVTPVVVHMATPAEGRAFLARHGLSGVEAVSDPDCIAYRAFGLNRGTASQLLGFKALARFPQAGIAAGHGVGFQVGDPLRMPGVFLIEGGQVVREFRHSSVADRPDYCELARSPVAAT